MNLAGHSLRPVMQPMLQEYKLELVPELTAGGQYFVTYGFAGHYQHTHQIISPINSEASCLQKFVKLERHKAEAIMVNLP